MNKPTPKKILLVNIAFVLSGAAILIFLWNAPDETTAHLPKDDIHAPFHAIESKKEAEKSCGECHGETGVSPLPPDHPPKYRCLFCHKRN